MPKARTTTSSTSLKNLSQGEKIVREALQKNNQENNNNDKNKKKISLTPFQFSVLAACAVIPRGYVSTYGAISEFIGRPGASRAVGTALSQNPFAPYPVPCHRVVGSNGYLTGFNGKSGVDPKKVTLLKEENVVVNAKGYVNDKNQIIF